MGKPRKATARKDFKLDGVLYKKGTPVDYLKWPRHTQFQLKSFLEFEPREPREPRAKREVANVPVTPESSPEVPPAAADPIEPPPAAADETKATTDAIEG